MRCVYVCAVITGPMGLQHSCVSDYPSSAQYILRKITKLELNHDSAGFTLSRSSFLFSFSSSLFFFNSSF